MPSTARPRWRRSVAFQSGPPTGTGFAARKGPGPPSFIWPTIERCLPCHAVTTNQRLFSAAFGGSSLAVTFTWLSPLGSDFAGVGVSVALGGLPFGIGIAHAITATAAMPAAGTSQRGVVSLVTSGLIERPIQPPMMPPATPAISAQITPSGISDVGQPMVSTVFDQAYS